LIGWCVFWCAASRRRRTRLPGMPASANRAHMPAASHSLHWAFCLSCSHMPPCLCIEAFCHIAHIWHCRRASLRWACRRQSTAAALLARPSPPCSHIAHAAAPRCLSALWVLTCTAPLRAHAGPSACRARVCWLLRTLADYLLAAIVLLKYRSFCCSLAVCLPPAMLTYSTAAALLAPNLAASCSHSYRTPCADLLSALPHIPTAADFLAGDLVL
jgi:hypothetical protein